VDLAVVGGTKPRTGEKSVAGLPDTFCKVAHNLSDRKRVPPEKSVG
jgi:hypothetical protein